MWIASIGNSGAIMLHHPDGGLSIDEDDRMMPQAGELEFVQGQGIRWKNQGPVLAGLLWQPKDRQKDTRLWNYGAPTSLRKNGQVEGLQLVAGPKWSTFRNTKPQALATPYELLYPVGWSFSTFRGADFEAMSPISVPGFLGLVAPHWAGDPERGSWVWDLLNSDELDNDRRALLQSILRVWLPAGAKGEPGALALQLGIAKGPKKGGGFPGAGIVADDLFPKGKSVTGGQQVLGALSMRLGGPIHVGIPADQHLLFTTRDGEPVHLVHTNTQQVFQRPDGTGDSSQRDGGFFRRPSFTGNLLVNTHWRHDPDEPHVYGGNKKGIGQWRFQTSTYIGRIPKRDEIPKPPPPPPGGKPPPGEGPVDGTGLPGEFQTPPGIPPDVLIPEEEIGAAPTGDGGGIDGTGLPGEFVTPGEDLIEELPNKRIERQIGASGVPQSAIKERDIGGALSEISFTGLVLRAMRLAAGAPDLRNSEGEANREELLEWIAQPAVLRAQTIASQRGKSFDYTQEPGGKGARHSNVGTADGRTWLMPAELGLEQRTLTGLVKSLVGLGFWCADLGMGKPLDGGLVGDGWVIEENDGGKVLSMTDSVGVKTTAVLVESSGDVTISQTMECLSRVYKQSAKSASFTAVPGETHFVNSSGGTITVTLPDNAASIGERVTILSVGFGSSNPIVINAAGSDAIGSTLQSSVTISNNLGSVILESDGAGLWGIVVNTGQPGMLGLPQVKSASFSAVFDESYALKTGTAAITVTLPAITANDVGKAVRVTDIDGNAAVNNMTLTAAGSDLILGLTTKIVNVAYGSVTLRVVRDGTQGIWMVV